MGMVVRTNTMALNANRQLSVNNSAVAKSLEKLASGYRINRAGDDASGLAISEKMKAQIKGLEQASANSQDGISLIQTAEGALTEVHNMLNRMVELATKSANGTIQDEVDREAIQAEVDALTTEITRISKSTNFNGINLLDGSMGLNKDAFTIGSTAAGEAVAGTAIDLTGKLAAEGAGDPQIHLGTQGIKEVTPYFEVDLADIKFTAAGGDSTFNISIGGTSLTATDALTDDTEYDGTNLAQALAAKNATIDYKGATYTVAANGTKLTFTYSKPAAGAAGDPIDGTVLSPSGAVTYTIGGGAKDTETGDVHHATINVTNPVVATQGERAGIDLTLDNTIVADGNVLVIDGQEFVFKTEADSTKAEDYKAANAGAIVIDVSDPAFDDDAKKIAEAADLLSQNTTTNFQIEAKSDTVIHVGQKVDSTQVYDTYGKLTGVFSANNGGTPATAATTDITIADDAIVDGNSITIGDKTYSFVSDASKALDGATAVVLTDLADGGKVSGEDAAAALAAAIGSGAVAEGNVVKVADGTKVIGGGLTLQVGDTNDNFNKVTVAVDDLSADGLGLLNEEGRLDVSSQDAAGNAIKTIKDAINQVSTNRANMGALQNRLEYTINNLDTTAENMTAANSRIRDTDMAKEMMNYTKMNILTQAAQAMLAQANQQPQAILQLLQ